MNRHFITIGGNKEFISGPAAIVELEKQLINYSRCTSDDKDVLVFLEPDNIPVLEIRGDKSNTVFSCEADDAKVIQMVAITHGQPFRASIDVRPVKGKAQTLTKFLHYRHAKT